MFRVETRKIYYLTVKYHQVFDIISTRRFKFKNHYFQLLRYLPYPTYQYIHSHIHTITFTLDNVYFVFVFVFFYFVLTPPDLVYNLDTYINKQSTVQFQNLLKV